VLAVALVVGVAGTASPAAAAPPDDILARLTAVPGLTVVGEQPAPAPYRFFVLTYTQPADHRHPGQGTFQQRFTLLHKDVSRPMVLHTTGYNVPIRVFRSEPARLVDGNQISVEQRFFSPSRPDPANWSTLDIWQAATDHHRIVQALKPIYGGKWISTGASKGGMTSVYHRRFYPADVDGTVAYVAPDDAVNREDSAYDRFFTTVGTDPACRQALMDVQVEALRRRAPLEAKYQAWATANGQTFERSTGSLDRSFEYLVQETPWIFWQYGSQAGCAGIPTAAATDDELYKWFDDVAGWGGYTDQGNEPFVPYYYQAGTQLGWPTQKFPHLAGMLRYPDDDIPRNYVPREIPMRFQPLAMLSVDFWVKLAGSQLLFVYGQYDPWGSEPFRLGPGTRDSFWYQVAGGNHGSNIAQLAATDRDQATTAVQRWAGVSAPAVSQRAAGSRVPGLDDYDLVLERTRALR